MSTPNPHKNKREIVEIIAVILEIVIPAVVAGITIWIESSQLSIESKIAALSIGVGSSILLLQLTIKYNYDFQKEHILAFKGALKQQFQSLHSEIQLNEVYKQFLDTDERLKPFIQTILESNNALIKKYIDEERTGALALSVYYTELFKYADIIVEDKVKSKGKYTGEVWALSCFLDGEWENNMGLETAWVNKLSDIDKKGVPTRRLYIFSNDKLSLLQESNDKNKIKNFLSTLQPYCTFNCSSQYKNTTSFAINRNNFSEETLSPLGKGFFAIKLSDGSMTLIRDLSIDNLSSNSLGGEIDFNESKKSETRKQWEVVMKAAIPLKEFLCININPSALTKEVLKELNIWIDEK